MKFGEWSLNIWIDSLIFLSDIFISQSVEQYWCQDRGQQKWIFRLKLSLSFGFSGLWSIWSLHIEKYCFCSEAFCSSWKNTVPARRLLVVPLKAWAAPAHRPWPALCVSAPGGSVDIQPWCGSLQSREDCADGTGRWWQWRPGRKAVDASSRLESPILVVPPLWRVLKLDTDLLSGFPRLHGREKSSGWKPRMFTVDLGIRTLTWTSSDSLGRGIHFISILVLFFLTYSMWWSMKF